MNTYIEHTKTLVRIIVHNTALSKDTRIPMVNAALIEDQGESPHLVNNILNYWTLMREISYQSNQVTLERK